MRQVLGWSLAQLLAATSAYAGFSCDPQANPGCPGGFPVQINGDFIRQGSVALGDLTGDGLPEIVVGASDGYVHAYTGSGAELWRFDTGAESIEGKPALADIDLDGIVEVVVGVGSTFTGSDNGTLFVLNGNNGSEQCRHENVGVIEGVFSSPALADLDRNDGGRLEIVYGSFDQQVRALHDNCTVLWSRAVRDTVWSSPAIGDLDRDGDLEVVIGSDAHLPDDHDGGFLWVFDGATGADRAGFPLAFNEVIHSSPALGDLDGDGFPDIVVGTGNCYGSNSACGTFHPGVGEYVIAVNRNGVALPGWPKVLPTGRYPVGSPALADLDRDGDLEVVLNTSQRGTGPPQTGSVFVFDGSATTVSGWPKNPSTAADCVGATVSWASSASPVVADLTGSDDLEILLPSNGEVAVWDRSGNQLSRTSLGGGICVTQPPGALQLATGWTISGTPAVGDLDGDGDLEVVAAGYAVFNQAPGAIWAWDFNKVGARAPWPVFRAGQENLGTLPPFFTDGFESGDTSAWSLTVP